MKPSAFAATFAERHLAPLLPALRRASHLLLLGLLLGASVSLRAGVVSETDTEFLTTGDFNGDGQWDVAIVDRYTGRVRLGYHLTGGIYNWVNWRGSGLKDVSSVTVGRLTDAGRDALALSSADLNLVTVLDAAVPGVPTPPVTLPFSALGPNLVLAADIGGAGNTPLHDLLVASIYNTDPDNRLTLFRNDGKTFNQIVETPSPGVGARGNRLSLQRGGPEYTIALVEEAEGLSFKAGSFASGQAELILNLAGMPAGANYVLGHFRGADAKDLLVYQPGETEVAFYALKEVAGQWVAGAARKFALEYPIKQLAAVDAGKQSRLLAVYSGHEPAAILTLDGEQPPIKLQQLAGMTNWFLNGAIVLPDSIVLVASLMENRSSLQYQVFRLSDGKAEPGAYGNLASLADTDDSTVPGIHRRILARLGEQTAADMKPYTNTIPGTDVKYAMVPIPGGEFLRGSPDSEKERQPDEGPQRTVRVDPFWMGQFEVTWNEYLLFTYGDDEKRLREKFPTEEEANQLSDAVTRPSKPYVDMSFGMGKDGFPAIAMTQHGANKYCHWLSAKTGHFYRLPTEAEWEYACRAGTTTAYSFGDDASKLPDYAWFFDNSNSKYQKVGRKKPNPWGLYDMHGNVLEWVLDQYAPDFYAQNAAEVLVNPWNKATQPYPHSARGGSWDDDPPALRSAARRGSDRTWKMQDPQLPKSVWYLSDAQFIGFRLIRPLRVPSPEEMVKYWTSGVEKD